MEDGGDVCGVVAVSISETTKEEFCEACYSDL